MRILKHFIPLVAFVLVSGAAGWQLGLLAGLVAGAGLIVTSRPLRVGVLEGGMLVFFAAMSAFAFAQPDSPVQDYVSDVAMAWLAAVSLASVALGRPFTLDFSRDQVSPEVARSAPFLAINRTITLAWSAAFAISAVAGPILVAADRPALARIVRIGVVVWAARFSSEYPDRATGNGGAPDPALAGQPTPPRP